MIFAAAILAVVAVHGRPDAAALEGPSENMIESVATFLGGEVTMTPNGQWMIFGTQE